MTRNQIELIQYNARFSVNINDIKIKLVQTPDETTFRIGKIQTIDGKQKPFECETAFNIYDAVQIWHRMMYEEIELQTGVSVSDATFVGSLKAA